MRYRKALAKPNYVILMDDREKKPWNHLHMPVKVRRLKTGDYTIEGWEKEIAIEKKSGFVELLGNLSKPARPRFIRFLRRLSDYPMKVMVVEQVCSAQAIRHAVQQAKMKSGGRCQLGEETLYHWIGEIQSRYGIPMLMGDRKTVEIMVPKLLDIMWKSVKGG